MRNWLQTGPSLLLWQLKSLWNGPNMAQKGSKRLQKAPPSTVWLYPGLMYLIWGPFTHFWDTKTVKIASELAHFLYFNFKPSGGWGTHLVSLKLIFFAFLNHTGSHKSPKNYRALTTFLGANPFLSEPQCVPDLTSSRLWLWLKAHFTHFTQAQAGAASLGAKVGDLTRRERTHETGYCSCVY